MTAAELIEALKAMPGSTEIRVTGINSALNIERPTGRERAAAQELRRHAARLRGLASSLADRQLASILTEVADEIEQTAARLT